MCKPNADRVPLLNTQVDNLTMEQALDAVCALAEGEPGSYVLTPNLHHLVLMERDKEFRALYQEADLVLTDGKPLIWASRLHHCPIREKVSGSDLFPLLAEKAAQKGLTMFFMGAKEGVARKAADILMERCPGLQVVGACSPAYGFEEDPEQLQSVLAQLRQAKPDILVLCLGSPKQEKFIARHRKDWQVPVTLGLGASLDFVAGTVKRAPRWMSECGLEWLYRVMQEPARLAGRYAEDLLMLPWLLWKYRPKKK